ncbi:MAG: hypothetical protein WAS07_07855 [Micropruina sp.]
MQRQDLLVTRQPRGLALLDPSGCGGLGIPASGGKLLPLRSTFLGDEPSPDKRRLHGVGGVGDPDVRGFVPDRCERFNSNVAGLYRRARAALQ